MRRRRLGSRLVNRWGSLPPRTIRLRLTAIYGGLFLLCGAALLAINYGLLSTQYTGAYFFQISTNAGNSVVGVARVSGGGLSATSAGGGVSVRSSKPVSGGRRGEGVSVQTNLTGGTHLPPGIPKPPSRAYLIASANAQSSAALDTLLIESVIALAIMALIAAGLGWIVAGRALRPLRAITATAREISASNLHRRLALAGPDDELRQFGSTFDALLERLETAFAAQRQFAANVSHELRTPLTYERTLIEVALADPNASTERLRAVLEQALVAGEHQERLIDALLTLSRGQRGLEWRETIDLATVAAQALGSVDTDSVAVERTLRPARTDGDPRLVGRLVVNLLSNAVQHNRPGGRVAVATRAAGNRAILSVTNTGPVMSPDDLGRLFEPFQRSDGGRTTATHGLGLGLSIVRAIADAHGATITTELPTDGGLSIEVAFPTADHAGTVSLAERARAQKLPASPAR